MPRVALVTATAALGLDPDLAPLAASLVGRGASAAVECWDRPAEWARYDAAILRSAWDYPEHLDEFIAWARATATQTLLLNDPDTIDWNADKAYLADLAGAGVATVPTTFVAPGEAPILPDSAQVVVKPSISAGSRDTARLDRDDPGVAALVDRIHAGGRTVMIQPYLVGVDRVGEHALVWFDGEPSHAFRKGPILHAGEAPTSDLFAEEDISPLAPTPAEAEVAAAAIERATERTGRVPLYARVDLVPDGDGSPLVLELELIEPSVNHWTAPGSADRFAAAILDAIDGK